MKSPSEKVVCYHITSQHGATIPEYKDMNISNLASPLSACTLNSTNKILMGVLRELIEHML
jgi:hypothetical protein